MCQPEEMQALEDGVWLDSVFPHCCSYYSLHILQRAGCHQGSLLWKVVWGSWAHTQGFPGVPTFYRTMLEEARCELYSTILLQGDACLPVSASAADSCISCDTHLSPSDGTNSEYLSGISSPSVPWLLLGLRSQGLSVTVSSSKLVVPNLSPRTSAVQAKACRWPPALPHKIN